MSSKSTPQTTPYSSSLSDYDYELPRELIAKYPLAQRDQSRMMVVNRQTEVRSHHLFSELETVLHPGDLLVMNNARVLSSRMIGHRQGQTGMVEIFLLNPTERDPNQWHVLMRPAKKLSPGTRVVFEGSETTLTIEERLEAGRGIVSIQLNGESSISEWMDTVGEVPLPPYLERPAEESDKETYQTVFSKVPCAHAAPTAGLHFTADLLARLRSQGIQTAEITLAVSLGTFRPVVTEEITEHQMDPEFYTLPSETAQRIQETQSRGHRVVAVGTTVAKTLETVARKQGINKTNTPITITGPDSGWSDLFILPGTPFYVVDALLTNFHLPKSTLMMLVSAFANRPLMMNAYEEAVSQQYRFYSYGDCMLIV